MDDDDDGGAVRTYNCFTPHSLLGGGVRVVTSYVSFTGHSVGPLMFPFGSSPSATKVHLPQQ